MDNIWKGKPALKPYVIKSFLDLVKYGIFIGTLYFLFYLVNLNGETNLYIFNFCNVIIALQGLYGFGKRLFEYRSLEYIITRDSVLITTNFISKRTKIISRDKILFIDIKNNIIDRYFNTTTIHFYSGLLTKDKEDRVKKDLDIFESISSKIEVLKLLEIK